MKTTPTPSSSFTLHDMPLSERPRERMVKYGSEVLSAQELLALVLGRGIQGESVVLTAQKLLSVFGSLEGVLQASLSELQKVRGLGVAKATQLKACLEIARRVSNVDILDGVVVMRPEDVFKLVKARISHFAKEHFVVLSFDARNKFLGLDVVSVGILNANIIHPRETFEVAIRRHAAQVIVSHNHPSGECTPSDEDREITQQLVAAGKILGIQVIDHVVISQRSFFSFADEGLL
jgi:DNA repair protein RadC